MCAPPCGVREASQLATPRVPLSSIDDNSCRLFPLDDVIMTRAGTCKSPVAAVNNSHRGYFFATTGLRRGAVKTRFCARTTASGLRRCRQHATLPTFVTTRSALHRRGYICSVLELAHDPWLTVKASANADDAHQYPCRNSFRRRAQHCESEPSQLQRAAPNRCAKRGNPRCAAG